MSDPALGLTMLALIVVVIMMGFPTAFTLMGLGMVFGFGAFYDPSQPWLENKVFNLMVQRTFGAMTNDTLLSIPLFVLMGYIMERGALVDKMFHSVQLAFRRLPGSLAVATLVICTFWGIASGLVGAVVVLMGVIAMRPMLNAGYDTRLAAGVITAGGTLGILIPPSVPLVIYAILAEQNIAKLFAAAIVPGVIAMVGYMVAIGVYVRLVPGQAPESQDREPMDMHSLMGILPIAIVFAIVFGGIYGGLFTPTEGAAVGAAATFVAALLKREITWAKFKFCFYDTATSSAMIFLIFIGADIMNASLALTQVPAQLAEVVGSWGLPPLMVVTAILLFYVVLGAVMDELSMILLTIPIFFPMIMGMDFGMAKESVAIWFGIMVLMTVGFGLLAPPVGLNVYVVNNLAKDVPIAESYRGVMPFLISDTLRTIVLLLFPALSLWLVQFVG